MQQLLSDIKSRLDAEVPALKYIDEDWGQLDYYNPHPPVKWPCGLTDVVSVQWSNAARRGQLGKAMIRIRIADMKLSNSSAKAPAAQQEKAFAIFDTIDAVHEALHGWSGHQSYSKLVRESGPARIPREDGVRIYELVYSTEVYEDSATPLATVSGLAPDITAGPVL